MVAAIIVVARCPVSGGEGRLIQAGDLLHAEPCGGVGRPGEDKAVVEEDGLDGLEHAYRFYRAIGWEDGWDKAIFSGRTGWDTSEGALARAVREARATGRELVDLTVSNPTVCGLSLPDGERFWRALRDPAAMRYEPDPRGIRSCAGGGGGVLRGHGAEVDPDALMLTTSTSEAYSFLFRLLCDAGDEVLVAQPSYPLFDFLADLDDVRLKELSAVLRLWVVDRFFGAGAEDRARRTKAILLVSSKQSDRTCDGEGGAGAAGGDLCADGLALIVDEVFLDYGLEVDGLRASRPGPHRALTFVVSGLSKIAALPQMKVGG